MPRRRHSQKDEMLNCQDILGPHPSAAHPFGSLLSASDGHTQKGVPHRALTEAAGERDAIVACIRTMLIRHHVSREALEREKKRAEAMKRLGFGVAQNRMTRFPTNSNTRKGKLAEVILAEYLVSATNVDLPVYRLRYNPNVDQAMKGDDVLAFDLDSDPVRIIVGESKFRTTSTKVAVIEMVECLVRSYSGGIPASLQFVADRLFETGNTYLGEKVLGCATLFALDKLRLDYVGLLMSDARSAEKINQYTDDSLHRLAVLSFAINSPESILDPCYNGLEE